MQNFRGGEKPSWGELSSKTFGEGLLQKSGKKAEKSRKK